MTEPKGSSPQLSQRQRTDQKAKGKVVQASGDDRSAQGKARNRIPSPEIKERDPQPRPHSNRTPSDDKRPGRAAELNTAKRNGQRRGNFLEQHKAGKFDALGDGAVAKKLDLQKQLELKHKGDVTLKLNLAHKVKQHGGWRTFHLSGLVGAGFGAGCSPVAYCGPSYFPTYCLYPNWSDWVRWCWWFPCDPVIDPRPWFCRPVIYDPCPVWDVWEYPVWVALPEVACGTWIDVESAVVDRALDLQLLAVRFVDPGHPEEHLGPRLRVWLRNNGRTTITQPFNVLLLAANSREMLADLPQAGVRVTGMEPGQIQAVDIRLPFEASVMGADEQGNPAPFSILHALVDSHREIPEPFEANNGAVIARGDILPVDPVILGTDTVAPLSGSKINIAGEGFGPEPGRVLVQIDGLELDAEIEGWYDLGVRVQLPQLAVGSPAEALLVVVRGDTAVSNPLPIEILAPVASR